jgi:small-conductance mechanosensitive channel
MNSEVYAIPGDRVEFRNGDRGTVERMVTITNVMVRTDAGRLIQTGTRNLKVIE